MFYQKSKKLGRKTRLLLKRRSLVYLLLGFLIILAVPLLYWVSQKLNDSQNPKSQIQVSTKQTKTSAGSVEPKPTPIPESASLVVPYTVQAPYANWAVHEESCEEAALLMFHYFLVGSKTDIEPATADREIRALKTWQVENWGAERDLTLEKVGELATDYYGHKFTLIFDLTEEKIKAQIVAGHPVLVPVLTQSLNNPHYSPGNVYHILLIKGYDATGVITNDAGIKEGKDWHYPWNILWSAVDAQTPKMGQGRVGMTLE